MADVLTTLILVRFIRSLLLFGFVVGLGLFLDRQHLFELQVLQFVELGFTDGIIDRLGLLLDHLDGFDPLIELVNSDIVGTWNAVLVVLKYFPATREYR